MRPRIICHMVSSVDGRLHSERWTPIVASQEPGLLMRVYEQTAERLGAQGWIVGRQTMQAMTNGSSHGAQPPSPLPRSPHLGQRNGRSLAVAVDPSGKLHYGADHVGGDHAVAILGEQVSDTYLQELRQDGVSYLFAGADGHDLAGALTTLGSSLGVDRLLLEGGGRINGAFLQADLIDELSLLIYPGIDGLTGIPSIFDFHGQGEQYPAAGRALRLLSCEALEAGFVWLRYNVERLQAKA
ncbi:RibD family protein [Pseudomonas hunanensis]|uniref:RibD family protein n=1 Tax=Pseudomonas hunanensis TaxID=1247546 RepID=UPI0037F6EC40